MKIPFFKNTVTNYFSMFVRLVQGIMVTRWLISQRGQNIPEGAVIFKENEVLNKIPSFTFWLENNRGQSNSKYFNNPSLRKPKQGVLEKQEILVHNMA